MEKGWSKWVSRERREREREDGRKWGVNVIVGSGNWGSEGYRIVSKLFIFLLFTPVGRPMGLGTGNPGPGPARPILGHSLGSYCVGLVSRLNGLTLLTDRPGRWSETDPAMSRYSGRWIDKKLYQQNGERIISINYNFASHDFRRTIEAQN